MLFNKLDNGKRISSKNPDNPKVIDSALVPRVCARSVSSVLQCELDVMTSHINKGAVETRRVDACDKQNTFVMKC